MPDTLNDFRQQMVEKYRSMKNDADAQGLLKFLMQLDSLKQSPMFYKYMGEVGNYGGMGDTEGMYDAIPPNPETMTRMPMFEHNPMKNNPSTPLIDAILRYRGYKI